ncbi:MAG: 16S rRNA (cytosine(1402)-N(4))-methyltransferase RsmH [Ruminococcaceae bacterium]|nr:16S rRNA (cytosine(1402)-N(4))-methyltransferase RsmH [Oscillospiraceae bacterium]
MEFKHISVLFEETMEALNIQADGIYADGTLGGGGHSFGILSRSKKGCLIGIDQDADAISAAKKRLEPFSGRVTYVNRNFSCIRSILEDLQIEQLDGAVLDLGVSSYQLDEAERGFSYMHDSMLDMRMNRNAEKNAYTVVNTYSKEELSRIFFEYGEEKWSKRVAEFIVEKRAQKPIETTFELVEIIKAAIPKGARQEGSHPAKRIFQAIRIEVNEELTILEEAIRDFVSVLKPGGRLAVITFHSLEDRIVKKTMQDLASGCTCPRDFPICVCNKKPQVEVITRKPILPSEKEQEENSRSKSAKLRVAEKLKMN